MTAFNAIAFAVLGAAMEALPRLFPAWFPLSADGSNARALWLSTMGAVQITLGSGSLLLATVVPALRRLAARLQPTGEAAAAIADTRTAGR